MADEQRMDIHEVESGARRAVLHLNAYAGEGGLDAGLLALVDIRASQINHCAWCLDMHTEEARRAGIDQRQIDLVAAWHETGSMFSEREQAALALTEAVTLISEHGVPDDVWNRVTAAFDDKETVHLLIAICAINVWNRMNVTVRTALPEKPFVA